MSTEDAQGDAEFHDAIAGLRRGDFSRLEPLFVSDGDEQPAIVRWYEQGRFADYPTESDEALTCACFLGAIPVAEYLLDRGLDPSGGMGTGLNAFHWASNRGQLEAARLLIARHAPLEVKTAYDGTVLGGAVWAAVHEAKPDHLAIIEALLEAGADVREAEYPSGDARVDELLRQFRERAVS